MSMMCRPMWPFLLMYMSHDMRHTGFPQVDGGQRDPREMGRHTDCSLAECDVDRNRPEAIRNVLEHANLLLKGYFQALYAPLYAPSLWNVDNAFSFFISSLGSPFSFSSTFLSLRLFLRLFLLS